MDPAFPTTGSAVDQVLDGDYDIVQLSKKVDEVIKGLTSEESGGKGLKKTGKVKESDDELSDNAQPSLEGGMDATNRFHLHTLSFQLNLVPPKSQVRRINRETRLHEMTPNEDRVRYDDLLTKIKTNFEPFEPFKLVEPSFNSLHVPLDVRGKVNTKAGGFTVLLPSKLQRKNVKPFLKRIAYPDVRPGKEWSVSSEAWDTRDWIQAAIALDPNQPATRKAFYRSEEQRVFLRSGIEAYWEQQGDGETAIATLSLILSIDCFLDLKKLWDPLPGVGNDLMGLIFHSLLPSPSPSSSMVDSERRADSLRHFYSCLRPAPPVPYSRSLQPNNMPTKLLPFQNRTVAWLLQRERAAVSKNAGNGRDPEGFWSAHDMGSLGNTAYRRLTGELVTLNWEKAVADRKGKARAIEEAEEDRMGIKLSEKSRLPTLLDLSKVEGSMLCEEMGLGKTVEAIALMLLNRHPLSTIRDDAEMVKEVSNLKEDASDLKPATTRRPAAGRARARPTPKLTIPVIDLSTDLDLSSRPTALNWWTEQKQAFSSATSYDAESDIDISQVAATLIVTPPSLLKQWVAEIGTHAPSLRVCVYTGWKGLLESVGKRAEMKRKSILALAKRKRQNDRIRAQTVRKYQKEGSGDRVKVEPDYDFEEDDEDLESQTGLEEESLQQRTRKLFVDFVLAHDVVITTYQDLATDLAVAEKAPVRSRRSNVDYRQGDRPRSPLVMCEWWRVIMDEVQLCSDTSTSAHMVSHIPRTHSLAVSGTPAKTDIKDLMGSLRFLGVPVLPSDNRLWHRLQQTPMRPAFDGLFRSIAVRTTKKEVSGEFNIPQQTRIIVPIELSEIEMHYYNDTLERQRNVLGLPADPAAPKPEGWYLDRTLFRSCLLNLRQICTHIQVGQMAGVTAGRGSRGDRLRLGKELLGLAEVLKKMKDDNAAELAIATRAQLRAMIRKAQLLLLDETYENRSEAASALYYRVGLKAQQALDPLRQELAVLMQDREESDDESDEEGSNDDHPLSLKEREQRLDRQRLRLSIRELLLILHQCYFFQGDWHHVQKNTDSEIESYDKAEVVRKELFAGPLRVANASIAYLEKKVAASTPIRSARDLQTTHTDRRGGLRTQEAIDQSNELLKIMNENALLVYSWREKIIELLKSPIDAESAATDDDGVDVVDPEKEYYAQALKAQGQVEAYLFAYAAAIADRREMMLEERSVLATHDARVTKHRTTKAAAQALADSDIPPDVPDDVAEEAAGLMRERQALKDARKLKDCEGPLKGIMMFLNTIVLGDHRREEQAIAQMAVDDFKAYIARQSEYIEKLNKELDVFRSTFNSRVSYFAAYQNVSDSVTAPIYKDLRAEIDEADQEILADETRLARCQVKSRYLNHLGDKQDSDEELKDDCIICFGSSDDTSGILLGCGHFFCTSCFREYRRTAMGSKCPSCRVEIKPNEGTHFRMGPKKQDQTTGELVATIGLGQADGQEEGSSGMNGQEEIEAEISPAIVEEQKRQADLKRLNTIAEQTQREISSMIMMGEFGSKINFLIKHLLYYRVKDKTARHVVFSNWSDSLYIVIQALRANNISFVSFDKGGKQGGNIVDQFIKDQSITVFLLHAEKESAGLTLTSCRVVHLLEPVLKHSFELQAIGRVDRLGQKEETTVYCYSTQDTVESRILSQGVRNGTSIYLKEEEQGDRVVEDMDNVVSAAHKGGDIGSDGNEDEMLKLIML